MKYRNRIFALLLSVMMVFTYMPAMAFAEAEEQAGADVPAVEQTDNSAAEQAGKAAANQNDDTSAEQSGEPAAKQTQEMGTAKADEPAAEQSDDVKRLASEQHVYINPEYEDVLSEKDVAIDGSEEILQFGAKGSAETIDYSLYESDESKIVETLRQAMVDRKETVPLHLHSTSEITDDQINGWIETALEETGSPVEGDYLLFTFGGSGYDVDGIQEGDDFYYTVTMYLTYYTTHEQEQELTAALNKVMAGFGFTDSTPDYKKIEAIYRYICDNVTYDNKNLNNSEYCLKFTAYAALINKTAVCQGYSNLLYRMLKMAGVDSRIVAGTSQGENHSWNIARIDGLYYNLDATWDTGNDWFGFYLKGSDTFTDHESESEYLSDAFTSRYPISADDYVSPEDKVITSGDFQYEVKNSKAELIKYSGTSKDVTVPASVDGYKVVAIGYMAFNKCDSLERLTLSEGIKTLESESIFECANLKELNLPSTLYIPVENKNAISGISCTPSRCFNLETINVAAGSKYLTAVDGVLFDKALTELMYYPPAKRDTEYTMPDGIEIIGPSAVEGNKYLTKVSMPDSVEVISHWAFSDAENLRTVNISDNCSFIGQFAFSYTAVERLELPAALELIVVDWSCYPDLQEWIVDEGNKVYSANDGVLLDKSRKKIYQIPDAMEGEYVVPDTVTSIMPYAAYYSKLSKITIPASTAIGSDNFTEHREDLVICGYDESPAQQYAKKNNLTFSSLGGFETVEIANGTCGSSMKWTFDNKGVLRISGSGAMNWDSDEAPWKSYEQQISKVVIEDGPENIAVNAFFALPALSSASIAGSVKKIGENAFDSCKNLSEVDLSEGVEVIEERAFFHCGITDLSLPSSIRSIEAEAFAWCQLEAIKVDPDNKYFTSKDDALFSKDEKTLVQYPQNGQQIYRVPDGVTTIGPYAFAYSFTADLNCPDSVQTIGENAFANSQIESAYLGDGIREIGESAFFNTWVKTIAVGKNLSAVRSGAFTAASALQTVLYGGNEAGWEKVVIEPGNQELAKADHKYLDGRDFCSSNIHSVALVKPYKEATETEDGNYEYYKCTKCGKLLFVSCGTEERYQEVTEEETIIPATGVPEDPGQVDPDPSVEPSDPGTDPTPSVEPTDPGTDPTPSTDPSEDEAAKKAAEEKAAAEQAAKEAAEKAAAEQAAKEAAEKAAAEQAAKEAAEKAAAEQAAKEAAEKAAAEQVAKEAAEKAAAEQAAKEAAEKAAAEQAAKEAAEKAANTGTPEITLSATDYTYKFAVKKVKVGKKKKKQAVATEYVPTVTSVKLNGKILTAADYEVSYSDPESKALGQYTVTVTLKGKYKGTGTATYSINPKPAKISKPAGGKKKMTVKWKKAAKNDITYKALDGYEIQYSLSSDFSSDDTKTTTASKKAKSKAIKKLQSKQTYYVRIRTYKNAGGVKLYSGWSAVKSVKVK